jgi:hypothetical protein
MPSRAERRREKANEQKRESKFFYSQAEIDEIVYHRLDVMIEQLGILARSSIRQAMRENRISEARAERILDRGNEIIKERAK